MKKPKIILADDHFLFRDGIKTMLELDDIADIIGEASDGNQLIEELKKQKPDLVLTDIDMPNMNGIEATKEALKIYPDIKIIALTMFGEENFYYEMIEAGAKGFVLKSSDKSELEDAIQKVLAGQTYFSNSLLQKLLVTISNRKKTALSLGLTEELTEREIEIIEHLAMGLSTAEIADKIHLSVKTIENYRTRLLNKTGCKNSTGLVVYAIKNKIIEL